MMDNLHLTKEQEVSILKDSGKRDSFGTGAVRDSESAKGRTDLLPLTSLVQMQERMLGKDLCALEDEMLGSLTRVYADDQAMPPLGIDVRNKKDRMVLANFCMAKLEVFKFYGYGEDLCDCFALFASHAFPNFEEALFELAIHYKDGANKYKARNWQRGLPLRRYIQSATNHLLKWQRGDQDEPHDRAFLWNLICPLWNLEFKMNVEELLDLPFCTGETDEIFGTLPKEEK